MTLLSPKQLRMEDVRAMTHVNVPAVAIAEYVPAGTTISGPPRPMQTAV
jgi:hypothetical protein